MNEKSLKFWKWILKTFFFNYFSAHGLKILFEDSSLLSAVCKYPLILFLFYYKISHANEIK